MFSPPLWVFVVAAVIATLAFIARYWILMPQYRVRFLVIPAILALVICGRAAAVNQSEMWPLLLYTDTLLLVTLLTIPYGKLLRQAAIEQAAGRPVPQVPGWVALPTVGFVIALIIGEGLLFR